MERYEAVVAYGYPPPGSPPDGLTIVPDAREKYPAIIGDCGGEGIEEVPMTDGMVGFTFSVTSSEKLTSLDCMRSELLGLAELNRSPS